MTLTIIVFLPIIRFAQKTYVPDNNFETYLMTQEWDNVLDDLL